MRSRIKRNNARSARPAHRASLIKHTAHRIRSSQNMRRCITPLITTCVLLLGYVPDTSAQPCTTRYSDESGNTSPTGTTFIAVSAFRLHCHGDIIGSLNIVTGSSLTTKLQIEKEHNGTWLPVERGNHIAHQADPGTYRLTIANTGKRGSFATWRLRYSRPLP